jgi:hypothetical protein
MRLIYFSPIPADSYAQRPHFLVQALCDQGVERVLWVEPYPTRLPQGSDLRRRRGRHTQGSLLDARVEVLAVPALPIEPLPGGAWLNRRLLWRKVWKQLASFAQGGQTILGIGKPSALARHVLRELRPTAAFYDAMDNFPEFYYGLSRRSVEYYEEAIAAETGLVLASSTYLTAKFARRGAPVAKVTNAYSMASLSGALPSAAVSPPAAPVLGYIGCLGPWFDWPLILALAQRMPQVRIEIIGPQMAPLPVRFPANLRLHPACSQSEAARWTNQFSAGLIPFHLNSLTSGIDPIKYYEYRAAGLPILSTRFGEMALRNEEEGVYFLDSTCNLPDLVSRATAHRYTAAELNHFRLENDWSQRFGRDSHFADWIFSRSPRHAA